MPNDSRLAGATKTSLRPKISRISSRLRRPTRSTTSVSPLVRRNFSSCGRSGPSPMMTTFRVTSGAEAGDDPADHLQQLEGPLARRQAHHRHEGDHRRIAVDGLDHPLVVVDAVGQHDDVAVGAGDAADGLRRRRRSPPRARPASSVQCPTRSRAANTGRGVAPHAVDGDDGGDAGALGGWAAPIGEGAGDAAVEVGDVDPLALEQVSATSRNALGVNGMSKGSRGTSMRCTRTPSITAGPGVGVMTTTSWPASWRWRARSWTCISMPPEAGHVAVGHQPDAERPVGRHVVTVLPRRRAARMPG